MINEMMQNTGSTQEPGEQSESVLQDTSQEETGEIKGQEQANPQEQAAYERVVLAGMKVLYDQQTNPGIMQILMKGADNPPKALSDVVSLIMQQLDKRSGGKIPQVVILPAATELIVLAAELAETAGLFKADERTMALAVQQMIISLSQQYGVNPAEVQQVLQSLDQNKLQQLIQQQQQLVQNGQIAGGNPAQGAGVTGATQDASATDNGQAAITGA